jgi:hypothetical protein
MLNIKFIISIYVIKEKIAIQSYTFSEVIKTGVFFDQVKSRSQEKLV